MLREVHLMSATPGNEANQTFWIGHPFGALSPALGYTRCSAAVGGTGLESLEHSGVWSRRTHLGTRLAHMFAMRIRLRPRSSLN